MAQGNFNACLDITLAEEGGWSDRKSDPGGPTMKGVTQRVYAAFKRRPVTKAELRAIPLADVRAVYKRGYWDKCKCEALPPGVDMQVFDIAVNAGPARAKRMLQLSLPVKLDGLIGPQTIAAAHAVDPAELIERLSMRRLAHYESMPKLFKEYGKGWLKRLKRVERAALNMQKEIASPA